MRKLPIPYYDYGPGIRESNESRVNRWVAYTMPTELVAFCVDANLNTPNSVLNFTFDEYIFDYDRGVVILKKTGEEIDLSVDITT